MLDTALFILVLFVFVGALVASEQNPDTFKRQFSWVWKSLVLWVFIPGLIYILIFNATCNWIDGVMDRTKEKIRAEKAQEYREELEERRKRRESRD